MVRLWGIAEGPFKHPGNLLNQFGSVLRMLGVIGSQTVYYSEKGIDDPLRNHLGLVSNERITTSFLSPTFPFLTFSGSFKDKARPRRDFKERRFDGAVP